MLFVDTAHEGGGWGQDLVDEDEDGLLRRKLNALADHVDKLSNGEVAGDQVLLLVDGCDVRLLDLLADDLCCHDVSMKSPAARRMWHKGLQEYGPCTSGECARPRPVGCQYREILGVVMMAEERTLRFSKL